MCCIPNCHDAMQARMVADFTATSAMCPAPHKPACTVLPAPLYACLLHAAAFETSMAAQTSSLTSTAQLSPRKPPHCLPTVAPSPKGQSACLTDCAMLGLRSRATVPHPDGHYGLQQLRAWWL
eukprot:CAMPEP_0202885084 /NCGR_PEP_ID=MMETSP1391-20130828/41482_1 /ASSEMBLY_ACC=CAM_ASM_000867 /TAXON_ID=1034604 /ORGANISM="Chlamydomonas leiostraca, Strain SAG 11-49" /LENGTH=122 /DNA_ID=CAMNT_0049568323 /DNA_START=9 /DNA_END=378 /DNA_ORIENTATION=+